MGQGQFPKCLKQSSTSGPSRQPRDEPSRPHGLPWLPPAQPERPSRKSSTASATPAPIILGRLKAGAGRHKPPSLLAWLRTSTARCRTWLSQILHCRPNDDLGRSATIGDIPRRQWRCDDTIFRYGLKTAEEKLEESWRGFGRLRTCLDHADRARPHLLQSAAGILQGR